MNELVQRLAAEKHPVIVGGSRPTLEEFKKRVEELEYVFLTFTETRGGTDLGVRLDKKACDLSQADFQQGKGNLHLEGTLTLNYVPVRCVADIDLSTLSGSGRLIPLEEARI
ncbi:hypothetical protein EI42_03171 [Thermosporothrix hazakensis]|jgi:hypothetical protein|uniref:MbtH domain protein n=1 Tax=Thermosporothrix hazakensis TaxID=644383 RepID=A0A326U797_THEHA|nr:MbtH domain protein [Thermosporothrix hazakensis]PZW28417.1 hypothetical protein EI42_03171 [Thermosporothrix hazakensis]GCE45197.1 hypothetical protein KTH_00660 [Thermosporothrix hazakensis]